MDASYLATLTQKTELIAQSVRDNLGDIIIWSDIDIQFFDFHPAEIVLGMEGDQLDLLFQELKPGLGLACGGFYAVRCSERTAEFFRRVVEVTRDQMNGFDQDAINLLLREGFSGVRHGFLPRRYYARIHGFVPPRDLALHHATCVTPGASVQQKLDLLGQIDWMMKAPRWRRPMYVALNFFPALLRRLCTGWESRRGKS